VLPRMIWPALLAMFLAMDSPLEHLLQFYKFSTRLFSKGTPIQWLFPREKNLFHQVFFFRKMRKNCDRYRFWKIKPRSAKTWSLCERPKSDSFYLHALEMKILTIYNSLCSNHQLKKQMSEDRKCWIFSFCVKISSCEIFSKIS
jgi:hypothetical protein